MYLQFIDFLIKKGLYYAELHLFNISGFELALRIPQFAKVFLNLSETAN